MYFLEKSINKFYSQGYTFFVNPKDLKEITNHLKKNSYEIYKPFDHAEKAIVFSNKPDIVLLEIKTNASLRHQDILGALFSLKIDDGLFGDIVIHNNRYYFYTFQKMKTFFENELTKIGKNSVELEEQDIDLLKDYQKEFEEIKIITSSLRIDSVIAKTIHLTRNDVKELIKDKKILYNYEILKSESKTLKVGDVFSIRKYGKYYFNDIISSTKKDNLIISIFKYVDSNN